MKIVCQLVFFSLFSLQVAAQVKYEREFSLNTKEVPKAALDFVGALDFKAVKWYQEEGFQKTSIEAKTTYRLRKYSIEFSSDGEIEDIEVKINLRQLPATTRKVIRQYFQDRFKKYKIQKIQEQWVGAVLSLQRAISQGTSEGTKDVQVNYEIVLKAKNEKKSQRLECLFDHSGKLLRESQIVSENSDNLEY